MSRHHPNRAARTLTLVLSLGLIHIGALIGMLLAEDPLWDGAYFALALLPLVAGLWARLRQRKTA